MPRRHQPIKHQPYEHASPCARKRRFRSEVEALDAIEHASLLDMKLELRTYRCPYCNNWHLSSSKQRPSLG